MYFFTSFFTDFEERDPMMLKGSDLKFRVGIIDKELNIFDNPYCEIKLHRYTSLNNIEDIKNPKVNKFMDKIIDIVDCDKKDKKENSNDVWNVGQIYYCPDYKDSDFLYSDYDQEKASWMRLAIHECDPKKRALEGKKCKSKKQI